VILGDPMRETQDTKAGHYRVDFRVGVGL